jgi:hypothetical protein
MNSFNEIGFAVPIFSGNYRNTRSKGDFGNSVVPEVGQRQVLNKQSTLLIGCLRGFSSSGEFRSGLAGEGNDSCLGSLFVHGPK